MSPDDLDDVCRIENEVFPNPWPRGAFESDVRRRSTYCTVVRNSVRDLVGYACLMVAADEANLTNIAVAANHRRLGIGSMLLDDLISEAERQRCRAMFLEVRPGNRDAISFYLRHGFTELYMRKWYYRNPVEDALVMVRPIGERNSHG
jgi:ribosomal-protein-alanine N-acetyltransferase